MPLENTEILCKSSLMQLSLEYESKQGVSNMKGVRFIETRITTCSTEVNFPSKLISQIKSNISHIHLSCKQIYLENNEFRNGCTKIIHCKFNQ